MKLLTMDDVSAHIGAHRVLSRIALSVSCGELVAVCGPNGAGKSSLLKVAAGLVKPSSGKVVLSGRELGSLTARERGERLAYLPQDRSIAWNMPAVEIAALGGTFLTGTEAMQRAGEALNEVGVGHLAHRGVAEMSGGERARVLLARALVADASLLLADEPVAGLDPDAALLVMEVLRRRASGGGAVLVTLHDLTLAASFADRVIVMDDGRVVADDIPLVALASPVLATSFRIRGHWVETENGPLLATRRLAD